ncbi:MAG: hypothetical protein P1P88_12540, partial [Bacteroidales bacterium]|nr:hypothetical protein [Bacteroidales bacterium]
MNNKANIFINTIQNENCFTELFTNFLKYDDFRYFFLKLLINVNEISVEYEDFTTQINLGQFGQPDIILSTPEIEFLFEVKVFPSTKLTKNQPLGYLNYLNSEVRRDKYKRLIFILPNSYAEIAYLKAHNVDIVSWEMIINMLEKLPNINSNF